MVTRKRRNMCMILDRLNFLTNVRSRVIISPNNKTERKRVIVVIYFSEF